ncbi:MAG TPA: PTS sorbitol transporter subunit IIC, partial [Thermoanaerobacterales bacterium]|nr:PTS sorbitol transporter subunit IIC [Thermoanaerobacterales bacterium]
MDALANFAQAFIGLFQEGGNTFLGLAGGILPTL